MVSQPNVRQHEITTKADLIKTMHLDLVSMRCCLMQMRRLYASCFGIMFIG